MVENQYAPAHFNELSELMRRGVFDGKMYRDHLKRTLEQCTHIVSAMTTPEITSFAQGPFSQGYQKMVESYMKKGKAQGKVLPIDKPVCVEDGLSAVILENTKHEDKLLVFGYRIIENPTAPESDGVLYLAALTVLGIEGERYRFAAQGLRADVVSGKDVIEVRDQVMLADIATELGSSVNTAIEQLALKDSMGKAN